VDSAQSGIRPAQEDDRIPLTIQSAAAAGERGSIVTEPPVDIGQAPGAWMDRHALGMLLYTVIASPGYFIARHQRALAAVFAALVVLQPRPSPGFS
jgi:hypothetical protein